MNKTASGGSITLTVLHAYRDEPLTLTGLKYSVLDANGTVLFGPADAVGFDPTHTQTDILIPGSLNETTEKFDVRTVRFKLITANGIFNTSEFYEIEGDVLQLTPYVDSFVSYPESLIVRRKISQQMPYYDALDDEDKAIALSNSFTRLSALKFGNLGTVQSLLDLTPSQIAALDPKFLEALKMAQLVEANHMVEVNPVRDKIKMGIISETIGESSMFFKQTGMETRSAYAGISDDAYPLLSKYLYRATSNPQIWKLRRS